MVCRDFDQIVERAKAAKTRGLVVVAGADDRQVIEAVVEAQREQIADAVLVGDANKIRQILRSLERDPNHYQIINADGVGEACKKAVQVVRSEPSAYLMKGIVETRELLKQVTARDNNLRTGHIMSHVAFNQLPNYPKLVVNTDGGMIPYPKLEDKKRIIINAVKTLRALGYERPKVAVLCAVEKVNPKLTETVDAAALKQMNLSGEIPGCTIEGPISYDLAMSAEVARIKRFDCPHCGDFDVLLVPNMVTGNILGKCWSITSGATMAGIVVGAKVPIVLTSRMASARERFLSTTLAAAVCKEGALEC